MKAALVLMLAVLGSLPARAEQPNLAACATHALPERTIRQTQPVTTTSDAGVRR